VQKEMVDHDFIDQLEAAAYAVIQVDRQGREVLQGTAWPVAPGILATNAHVANLVKGNGGDLIVRKPGSEPGGDGDFKVIDAVIHDGYSMFSKFDSDTKATSSSYAALGNDARRTGYDVALLKVEQGDAFGPILTRAPESEVVALDSGMPLAYAGYPIGGTAEQGSAQLKPTPTVQYGRITSVTDFFMFGTDPQHAYLVQHSLPTFKGASGSPIINGKGEVVAILSGGHVVETTEGIASNAVMRNFAQRIDLVAPLLGETTTFDLTEEQTRWSSVAEKFNNHRNSVIEDVKEHLASKAGGSEVIEVASFDGSLTGSDVEDNGFQRFIDHEVPVEADGHYAFLVYGSEGAPISLIVYREGETPAADGGAASFASVDANVAGTKSVRVRVLGLAKNPPEQYTLYVYRAAPGDAPSAAVGTDG
jgi:S1-C subfamily serine protease